MRAPTRRLLGAVAVVGILAATTAACSGAGTDSKASSSAALPLAGTNGAKGPAPAAAPGSRSTPEVDLAVAKRPADQRQVISTAQLELEARDIDQTVQRATALVLRAQGYVFSESASLTNREHADVVFKVLPASFNQVVGQIGALGKLVHRNIGTQDVTGQVVDLNARLAAAQTSADRLRQLLANSGSVADLLSVEGQLTAREGQVDSLSGQLGALDAQIQMATITLDVSPTPTHRAAPSHHEQPGFTRGLHSGSGAFADSARVVAAVLGFALPFAPIGMLALAAWWVLRRRGAAAPTAS